MHELPSARRPRTRRSVRWSIRPPIGPRRVERRLGRGRGRRPVRRGNRHGHRWLGQAAGVSLWCLGSASELWRRLEARRAAGEPHPGHGGAARALGCRCRDVLAAIAGFDADDPTSVERAWSYARGARTRPSNRDRREACRAFRRRRRTLRPRRRARARRLGAARFRRPTGREAASEACGHLIRADASTRYARCDERPACWRRAHAAGSHVEPVTAQTTLRSRRGAIAVGARGREGACEVDFLLLPTIPVEPPLAGADRVVTTEEVVSTRSCSRSRLCPRSRSVRCDG